MALKLRTYSLLVVTSPPPEGWLSFVLILNVRSYNISHQPLSRELLHRSPAVFASIAKKMTTQK